MLGVARQMKNVNSSATFRTTECRRQAATLTHHIVGRDDASGIIIMRHRTRQTRSLLTLGVAVAGVVLFTACSDLPTSPSRALGAGGNPLFSKTDDSVHKAEEAAQKAAHDSVEDAKRAAEAAKK